MKWTNKGHQFDEMYSSMEKKSRYYLFGAGDYGHQFYKAMKDEIEIAGFIDNSASKRGKSIDGMTCYGLDQASMDCETGIIVTMSQIARVASIEQLKGAGYEERKDFFVIEEFLSVYYVYKHDQVYFSSISFLPSTACNLKCRHCLNFNPFAKRFYVREWEDLIRDVDLFFSCVDKIMLFHVSGGEPMLYKHTADLISYIYGRYGDRIGTLRTVTNGTVVPGEDVLKKLSESNVEVTVDDYRDAVPEYNKNFEELIKKLKEYNIRYYINKAEGWIDLAPERTDYSSWTEEQLIRHRDECSQSWQELRGGKLYSCNYAAYAAVAGISGKENMEETYSLGDFDATKKKELVEFRLGYAEKGYTNFCKKCRGFVGENPSNLMPAIQI